MITDWKTMGWTAAVWFSLIGIDYAFGGAVEREVLVFWLGGALMLTALTVGGIAATILDTLDRSRTKHQASEHPEWVDVP